MSKAAKTDKLRRALVALSKAIDAGGPKGAAYANLSKRLGAGLKDLAGKKEVAQKAVDGLRRALSEHKATGGVESSLRHLEAAMQELSRCLDVLDRPIASIPVPSMSDVPVRITVSAPPAAPLPAITVPPEDAEEMEIHHELFADTREQMQDAEAALLALEQDPQDRESISAVFRVFHTAKGGAAMVGQESLARFAHAAESLIDDMREGRVRCVGGYAQLALQSIDMLRTLIDRAERKLAGEQLGLPPELDQLIDKLNNPTDYGVSEEKEAPAPPASAAPSGATAPPPLRSIPVEVNLSSPPALAVTVPPADEEEAGIQRELFAETRDQMENAELALLALERDPTDASSIATVFRVFHTAKGGAALLNQESLARFAHAAETLLSRMREGDIRCEGGYAQLALQSIDMLRVLIDRAERKLGGADVPLPEGFQRLVDELNDPEKHGISGTSQRPSVPEPATDEGAVATQEQPPAATEQPRQPPAAAAVPPAAPVPSIQSGGQPAAARPAASLAEIAEQTAAAAKPAAGPASKARAGGDATVRVRTATLDQLINLVGEMVISQSMINQSMRNQRELSATSGDLQTKLAHMGKLVRELQETGTALRMVPLKATFQKMNRVVRDTARKGGKDVRFVTVGDETELDRQMVDTLGDPLIHMVRNAVDHGVEKPEDRERAGKSGQGTVTLSAEQAGSNVVVRLTDDGAGLNRDKIWAKALQQGLVTEGQQMTDSQVFSLIFEPGFSTAEKVTSLSGRGVGMDVVKQALQSLGARVEITSELGSGTSFAIILPLTLAVTDGMLVRVGLERYVVPIQSVRRSFRPRAEHLQSVAGNGELLNVAEGALPLFRLNDLFGVGGAVDDASEGLVLLLEEPQGLYGLLVDELLGQQQVVVKSLGDALGRIPGISGGAVLGDGKVGLILDPSGLADQARCGGFDTRAA